MEIPQVEYDTSRARKKQATFFDLPTEIRYEVYSMILLVDRVVDFDPKNYRTIAKKLQLFLVSKKFYQDASQYFYSQNMFRLFPTHGNFFSDRQMPLIRCLSPNNRAVITRLELRFGPGWTKPPRSWKVSDKLGLKDLVSLRRLDIYIEIDPSSNIFKGFRTSKGFYTDFSSELFSKTIASIPFLEEVRFAGYSFAVLEDPLLAQLVRQTKMGGKKVTFGGSWSRTLANS
jgi:hypothetical protein